MGQEQDFPEPKEKRATAFFDGQNLYRHAKTTFGHHHPNYDPLKLHAAVCKKKGWQPSAVRFYTGIPNPKYDRFWHGYWVRRLLGMSRTDIHVTNLPLGYRQENAVLLDGATIIFPDDRQVIIPEDSGVTLPDDSGIAFSDNVKRTKHIPSEKGIDIRLALDAVRLARQRKYDVAVFFSQDQDFAQAVEEIKDIAQEQKRWIKLVCAFPYGPSASIKKGIRDCEPFRMDEAFYNACLDPRDYRLTNQ